MNEKMDLSKVMDKIKKLLALSGSSNENEAASAAEKAQSLLAEYNLSMSDVNNASNNEDNFIVDDTMKTDSLPWRRSLGTMIGRMYFSSYFFTFHKDYIPSRPNGYIRYDKHHFIGSSHNVEIAKVMFKYLTDTVERLANDGALKYPANERSKYRTSFKAACSSRLCNRINDRIEAAKRGEIRTESGSNLPALASLYDQTKHKLDSFIKAKVGPLRSHAVRHTTSHSGGIADGRSAGDRIGLDQQVGGDKQRRIGKG